MEVTLDHYISGVCFTSSHKEFGEDGEFRNKMSLMSLLILSLTVDVQRNKFSGSQVAIFCFHPNPSMQIGFLKSFILP